MWVTTRASHDPKRGAIHTYFFYTGGSLTVHTRGFDIYDAYCNIPQKNLLLLRNQQESLFIALISTQEALPILLFSRDTRDKTDEGDFTLSYVALVIMFASVYPSNPFSASATRESGATSKRPSSAGARVAKVFFQRSSISKVCE